MKRVILKHLAPLAAALAFTTIAASAAENVEKDRPRDRDRTSAAQTGAVEPFAYGGVAAPNARLAALVDAGGAPIRTSGVQSIQRIATGVYCIRPATGSNINVNNSIVMVSPEYFYSNLDEITVQWAATQSGCGAGRFGIYTFADSNQDGNYTFSNEVGFSVYVP